MGNIDTFNVINEIRAERERQKDTEGWTEEHDDEHTFGELAKAAAMYCISGSGENPTGEFVDHMYNNLWPWLEHPNSFKPGDNRRDLIKAAALIVAEIERLDRANGMGRGTDD